MKLNSFRVCGVLRFCAVLAFLSLLSILPTSPVAAATLGWIGYTISSPSPGSVDPTTDLYINTEMAPHGAVVSALVSYSTNGGVGWHSVALANSGTVGSDGNDQWYVDLGRFTEGTVVQYLVQATDSLGHSMWDSNYWQGFYVKVDTLIRDVY